MINFLTLSEKEIKTESIYRAIRVPHIVISISGDEDNETLVPSNQYRRGLLHLKFDDVSDIDERYLYFTHAQAREILDFVNRNINSISLIIVQCHAGLSRSVGTAAALAKIINCADDEVFRSGIPNMFVYTTILEAFFGNPHWQQEYNKIHMMRLKSMGQYLSPALIRLSTSKENKRLQ